MKNTQSVRDMVCPKQNTVRNKILSESQSETRLNLKLWSDFVLPRTPNRIRDSTLSESRLVKYPRINILWLKVMENSQLFTFTCCIIITTRKYFNYFFIKEFINNSTINTDWLLTRTVPRPILRAWLLGSKRL